MKIVGDQISMRYEQILILAIKPHGLFSSSNVSQKAVGSCRSIISGLYLLRASVASSEYIKIHQ